MLLCSIVHAVTTVPIMPNSASSSDAPLGAKHANVVSIEDPSNGIRSIEYLPDSLVIATGQPADVPPSITATGGVFTITLQAGRHKSKQVADTFRSQCGDSPKMFAPSDSGGTPDELHFIFGLTITFKIGGSATVYLAQGHHFLANNWWIGGDPVFSQNTPRLEYTLGNKIYTFAISGNHNTFQLNFKDTRPVSSIEHVFVLMLENHSFDNILALSGIPGIIAATSSDCNSYSGNSYCVQGNAPVSMPTDPGHEFADVVEQLAGDGASYTPRGQYPPINNSGFVANYATTKTEGPAPPPADIGDIMKCFDTASQLPMLHQLANEFVVCDQWFSSLPGPTWPNRFFLHGASSNGLDHSPSSAEMFDWELLWRGFVYPRGSIFDAMNAHGITWRLYHDDSGPIEGRISQVSAIHGIDLCRVHDLSDFESEVQSSSYPYQYTFIEPNYGDVANGTYEGGSSQHPMDGVANGDALIAKIYESIRNSPLWPKSLLIITYDEHGGFYDHYAPGPAQPPDDGGEASQYNKSGFNFAQYGVRVPAVIVSPLLEKNIDHTLYDHASVLATLEWLFGLPPLTKRDEAANVIQGVKTATIARTNCPQRLKTAQAQGGKSSPLTAEQRTSREQEPIPDSGNLAGFVGVLLKADSSLATTPEERRAAVIRFQSVKTRGDARAYIHEVMNKVQTERAQRSQRTTP